MQNWKIFIGCEDKIAIYHIFEHKFSPHFSHLNESAYYYWTDRSRFLNISHRIWFRNSVKIVPRYVKTNDGNQYEWVTLVVSKSRRIKLIFLVFQQSQLFDCVVQPEMIRF